MKTFDKVSVCEFITDRVLAKDVGDRACIYCRKWSVYFADQVFNKAYTVTYLCNSCSRLWSIKRRPGRNQSFRYRLNPDEDL